MVNQNGVPFMQLDEVSKTAQAFRALFADWHFYGVAVPTYIGGLMTLGWASQTLRFASNPSRFLPGVSRTRPSKPVITPPPVHGGAFALPRFVEEAIGL